MSTVRLALVTVGVVVGSVGVALLVASGPANILAAGVWLVGGVVLHDGLIAPATIGVVVTASAVLPGRIRRPATVGFVVLGSVTLLAVPVLGRFGAKADNPTLLDRNYWAGWTLVAGLVLLGVSVAVVTDALRRARRDDRRPAAKQEEP